MSAFKAIVLGVVQGLTEFLPISSSAHLILTSHLMGWRDQGLAFDMAANSGSLLAIMVFLRRDLARLAGGVWHTVRGAGGEKTEAREAARLAALLTLATVPVAVAGWLGRDAVASYARSPWIIAWSSILFALALGWADRRPSGILKLNSISWMPALVIGCAQALALIPGTSRSGVTLTAALLLGMSRSDGVRFSFLLAIPVGLLVAGKQFSELLGGQLTAEVGLASIFIGFAAAAVSAYAAVVWLVAWVRRQRLTVFVVYRVILGLVLLGILIGG